MNKEKEGNEGSSRKISQELIECVSVLATRTKEDEGDEE
jgi:hypothetical protein